MDRLIYLSMSGAKATMQRQETLANNLANVSTVGFRAELAAFRAVPVEGSGASTRVFALESTPGYDASPGQVAATGRKLDVAMAGSRLARRPGARRHRGLHALRRARHQRRRQPGHELGPHRHRRRRPDQPAARDRSQHLRRRQRQRDRHARPQQHHRQAQAGHSRRAAGRAAATACFAPPTAISPPTRRRASRTARSKART